MNLHGKPARVGHHCGSSTYTATREVVDFYEDALDDHSPLYREVAPPLLHHSECYRFLGEWYLHNLIGNLHAQQDWEMFEAIPVGTQIRTRSTIVDRYHKRGRDYVVNETDVVAADDGRLFVRGRTHQSFLATSQKASDGFVVDAGTAKKKEPRPPFPTATGEDLAPVRKTIDARRCWMFSGPGRNCHTDAAEAQKLGFPGIVVQGMMTTCFAAQVMTDRFGRGFLAGGRMSLKLTNVVWENDALTARARIARIEPEGVHERVHCEVWVEKDDATRVLIGTASALRPGEAAAA